MEMFERLKELLKNDERFVSDGKLLKNRIIELGLKLDKQLLKLLLNDERIRAYFFEDVDGVLVFDKDKFLKFVDNKEFLPDSYTSFKNKIGLASNGNYLSQSREVVLCWPYKDCVLEGGQESPEEKRREIFYNEILAPDEIDRLLDPKVFTNFKRIDREGEHEVDDFMLDEKGNIKDNLIIRGNNLLVLHSLSKRFAGKVKLIYIDPPYNTGNDEFKYNDSFNHSTWLTFMKNRLEVAKKLLRDDGVIFVQCDDREHAYLKILMDEIFGRENYISSIAVKVKAPSGVATGGLIFDVKENILVYGRKRDIEPINNQIEKEIINAKSKTIENYKMFFESEGEESEKVAEIETQNGKIEIKRMKNYIIRNINVSEIENIENFYAENFEKIFRTATLSGGIEKKIKELIPDSGLFSYYHTPTKGKYKGQRVKFYVYKKEGILFLKENAILKQIGNRIVAVKMEQLTNIITQDLWQGISNEGGVTLKYGKKPEELLRLILNLVTKEDDLVLDFFAGSGTTCAVAHKMGRQYIGVEQLDYGENSAVVRLKNVIKGDRSGISRAVDWQGGGDFVYMELMKLNEDYMERIQDAKDTESILNIWDEMKLNGFLSYRVDPKLFDENIEEFKNLPIDEQKRLLAETLDKNYLYVNFSEIDDELYKVSSRDKEVNRKFYGD
ncbi:MAG: site-specific DNA-methyltransferase [Nitrososphaeria archaeon]